MWLCFLLFFVTYKYYTSITLLESNVWLLYLLKNQGIIYSISAYIHKLWFKMNSMVIILKKHDIVNFIILQYSVEEQIIKSDQFNSIE